MTYQLHPESGVIVIATGERIERGQPGWDEYRAWTKAGNAPSPATVEVEPIEALAERVIAKINQERNLAEQAGFPYLGKTFDSDQVSAIRISNAALAAQAAQLAGQPFFIEWTAADNTKSLLDGAAMMGMPAAMASQANTVHQAARVKKDEVLALLAAGDRAGLEQYGREPEQPMP